MSSSLCLSLSAYADCPVKMGCSSSTTVRGQLAWAHDWHIREEGDTAAHAILVNAKRQLPLASLWGDGTTSSSDGQYFAAGGHAEAIGDLNACYGPNPGANFYGSPLTGPAFSTSSP
ncbi:MULTISPECIES: Tn3 family transposase [Agrobacterium]|jgi:TnpA family transposase|uniref:Tn3 family transposase n=2 Tax=Agrobacterium TaxID=357 RepID=A0AA44EH55_9HYPH|nr:MULTISPECIES: Tn3 family transposase [Agrobacterium]MDH0616579.1 Tn3 family transposase [Agrobacterium sp. GD03872]MDH2222238.1 Tn3 family transposase [Agrobacterium sp. GD03638]NRF07468.1 Tn3 family transposase [Agrobacterium pusense]NRF18200.1 Tn3 family transposase [Agrobacterium pusense]QCL92595.1 hypothetical protein CFBP6623_25845 [Agrobacterium tumefaciens]